MPDGDVVPMLEGIGREGAKLASFANFRKRIFANFSNDFATKIIEFSEIGFRNDLTNVYLDLEFRKIRSNLELK